jgi:hypothetical protein
MSKSKTTPVPQAKPPVRPTGAPASGAKTAVKDKAEIDFAFGRINYIYMLVGMAFIVVGFIMMSGGKADNPSVFNPEIFSFRRITLAPVLVIVGYIIEVYAIVKKAED